MKGYGIFEYEFFISFPSFAKNKALYFLTLPSKFFLFLSTATFPNITKISLEAFIISSPNSSHSLIKDSLSHISPIKYPDIASSGNIIISALLFFASSI